MRARAPDHARGRPHRRFAAACFLTCVGLLAGCGPSATLTVRQPGLPPPMDELRLRSRWAYFDTNGRERYLVSFPFPGAEAGDRQFILYLVRDPRADDTVFSAGPGGERPPDGAGFFVQERGTYAGLTQVVDGLARVRGVPFGGRNRRRLELTLHCDDGTTITGRLRALRSRLELARFEQGPHAADVTALPTHAPPAQAVDAGRP